MIKGISGQVFDKSECQDWKYFKEPFYWCKHNLTVIADRCLPDGTRQHMVIEPVTENCVLDNAQIFYKEQL